MMQNIRAGLSLAALLAPAVAIAGDPLVRTLPLPAGMNVQGGTYTPSGKVLFDYHKPGVTDPRDIVIATVNDDGTGLRTLFAGRIPDRPKDNGLRYMIFPDNKRVFMGDFVLECRTALERCSNPQLLPVTYPREVADGPHILHRWSEMIIAPDNKTVAWTTLFTGFAAAVFLGEMRREGAGYVIANPRIISTTTLFAPDPRHADGVLPQVLRNGEVKQFVHGGGGISMAGALSRDMPDSVVQNLASGQVEAITDTPGYTETTIFSPDEKMGLTMTTRFSPTDPAILGLVPRPYPAALNMGMNMFAYTYAVTGVRRSRPGNVGPALIDIQSSKRGQGYQGINLNTADEWVYHSPMSWHQGSTRAMWVEGKRGTSTRRLQIVELRGHRPGKPVPARPTPAKVEGASSDLSIVSSLAARTQNMDVKVYGRTSGYLTYRRTPATIEKRYFDFSDDGRNVYSGAETLQLNMGGRSTYVADVTLAGPQPGRMDLKLTFGPLGGNRPATIIFDKDESGAPLTRGYAQMGDRRLDVSALVP